MVRGHNMHSENNLARGIIPRLILIKLLNFKICSKNKNPMDLKASMKSFSIDRMSVGIILRVTNKESRRQFKEFKEGMHC